MLEIKYRLCKNAIKKNVKKKPYSLNSWQNKAMYTQLAIVAKVPLSLEHSLTVCVCMHVQQ